MNPMIGANRTVAKYWAELKTADAVPRSFAGNQAATMRLLAGKEGASANPIRKRSANRTYTAAAANQPTKPTNTVNRDQKKMEKKYTILEPNRSSAHPPGICPMTYDQPNAEKMKPICTGERPRSLLMTGP